MTELVDSVATSSIEADSVVVVAGAIVVIEPVVDASVSTVAKELVVVGR